MEHEMTGQISPVSIRNISLPDLPHGPDRTLDEWLYSVLDRLPEDDILRAAASHLRFNNTPIAFPTETVYGLGADATRSSSVKGIYAAKQRPLDNPLIVHVCSLKMLRSLLLDPDQERRYLASPSPGSTFSDHLTPPHSPPKTSTPCVPEVIPQIYLPLIEAFWPGPLTIILPVPQSSKLAPEVTAGLDTFAARMPKSVIALVLIRLCGVTLAAPSANVSGRPSPTTAQHVYDDLSERVGCILDGGDCDVGVESTVVDGLSSPPAILRPGGITLEQIRRFPGWEGVVNGYDDSKTLDKDVVPRAPGMKYTHYSPSAKVVLFESGAPFPAPTELHQYGSGVGVLTAKHWSVPAGEGVLEVKALGTSSEEIARNLFASLRAMDVVSGVDTILVEGVTDEADGSEGVASAVMNRLRKAATEIVPAP
jgi:L-threonylcarbamoyladenylate synthase